MSKVDYVRSEALKPAGNHHCHWPGCDKPVPPAMWGCKTHWFKLPMRLRSRIWATYRPGQEVSKTPSAEYLAVARDVQEWIAAIAMEARQGGNAEERSHAKHDSAGPQDIAQPLANTKGETNHG